MKHNVKTVIGAGYGDEGKGKVITMLANEIIARSKQFYSNSAGSDILGYGIRSNGGPNGGHALVGANGQKVTGHVLPSLVTVEGFHNVIGTGCAIHLAGLEKEIQDFKAAEVFRGSLSIDPKSAVILDAYRKLDGFRGKHSTGSGIADAYGHVAKRDGIKMSDLIQGDLRDLENRIVKLSSVLRAEFESLTENSDTDADKAYEFMEISSVDYILRELKDSSLAEFVDFGIQAELAQAIAQGRDVLNETSQSYFLSLAMNDQNGTSSIIDPSWLFSSMGLPIVPQEVHLITKLFPSRVGYGAFPGEYGDRDKALDREECINKYNLSQKPTEEEIDEIGIEAFSDGNQEMIGDFLRLKYNEFGETTGRPRGKAPLDLIYLRTLQQNIAASPINETYLWINQFDGLEGVLDEIPLIESYNRGEITHFDTNMPDTTVRQMKPDISHYPIWKEPLTSEADLPKELINLLNIIELETQLNIGGIGIGRKDNDVITYDYINN